MLSLTLQINIAEPENSTTLEYKHITKTANDIKKLLVEQAVLLEALAIKTTVYNNQNRTFERPGLLNAQAFRTF